MQVRYLVLAHRSPRLLDALATSLCLDEDAVVHIHVDRKAELETFRHGLDPALHDRVHLLSDDARVDVGWGGWSQVEAALSLIRSALVSASDDDRLVLLSGDSFPLQHPSAIRTYYEQAGSTEFINIVRMPDRSVGKSLARVNRMHLQFDPRTGWHVAARLFNALHIPRAYRRRLGGRTPSAGSQWWALTARTLRMILAEDLSDPRFLELARRVWIPDEFFFQTALSTKTGVVTARSTMFTDFSRKDGPKPAWFDIHHVRALESRRLRQPESGYGDGVALFARKFQHEKDTDLTKPLWAVSLDN